MPAASYHTTSKLGGRRTAALPKQVPAAPTLLPGVETPKYQACGCGTGFLALACPSSPGGPAPRHLWGPSPPTSCQLSTWSLYVSNCEHLPYPPRLVSHTSHLQPDALLLGRHTGLCRNQSRWKTPRWLSPCLDPGLKSFWWMNH